MTFSVTRERDMIIVQVVSGGVVVKASEHRGHMLHFWHELGKLVIENPEDRAKAGYERFHAAIGGAFDAWEQIAPAHREAWIAAFTE